MISRREFLKKLGCILLGGFLFLSDYGRSFFWRKNQTLQNLTTNQPLQKMDTQKLSDVTNLASATPHQKTQQLASPASLKSMQPAMTPKPTWFNPDLSSSLSPEMVEFIASHPIQNGDQSRKVIMMTYDDGNRNDYIHRILDDYKEFGVKCTLFFCGIHLRRCAESIQRAVEEDHLIGFHGYDHEKPMVQLRNEDVRRQVEGFLEELSVIIPGYPVRFWRAPYGSYNTRILKIAAEYGMQHVGWSVESGGMSEDTVEILRKRLERYARRHGLSTPNGAIVLSHATRYYDIHLAAEVLKLIQSYGQQPVTVAVGMKDEDRYTPPLEWNEITTNSFPR